jgi:hypothetical protein
MPNMRGRNRDPCLRGKNLLNQQASLVETWKVRSFSSDPAFIFSFLLIGYTITHIIL